MVNRLILSLFLAVACCTSCLPAEADLPPQPKLSVEELARRTSEIKAAQPEVHREFIRLYKHCKNFANFISERGGYNNEPMYAADAGYLLLLAEKDLNFDTARVYKEYSHLARIAVFVGYLKGEDDSPELVQSLSNGDTFHLLYESGGQLHSVQFDPDSKPRSYKLKRIGGKHYLILKWSTSGDTVDENEYAWTQYVLIENAKFTVEKTNRKVIPR